MKRIELMIVAVALVLAACGYEQPTCQQAVESFYGAGCTLQSATYAIEQPKASMLCANGLTKAYSDSCVTKIEEMAACLFESDACNSCNAAIKEAWPCL